MDQIIYDGSLETKKRIFTDYPKGKLSVICPRCREEIVVVITPEDAAKYQKGPGLYCPNRHFWVHFDFR